MWFIKLFLFKSPKFISSVWPIIYVERLSVNAASQRRFDDFSRVTKRKSLSMHVYIAIVQFMCNLIEACHIPQNSYYNVLIENLEINDCFPLYSRFLS